MQTSVCFLLLNFSEYFQDGENNSNGNIADPYFKDVIISYNGRFLVYTTLRMTRYNVSVLYKKVNVNL